MEQELINGIIVQPTSLSCTPAITTTKTDKTSKVKVRSVDELLLPVYVSTKRESSRKLERKNFSQALTDASTLSR